MSEKSPILPPVPEQSTPEADRLPIGLKLQQVGALTVMAAAVVGGAAYGATWAHQESSVIPAAHEVAGQERALDDGFVIPRAEYDNTYLYLQVGSDGEECTVPAFVDMEFDDHYNEEFRLLFEGTEVTEAHYEVALPESLDERSIDYVKVDTADELQALADERSGATFCDMTDQHSEKFPAGLSSDYEGIMGDRYYVPGVGWVGLP